MEVGMVAGDIAGAATWSFSKDGLSPGRKGGNQHGSTGL